MKFKFNPDSWTNIIKAIVLGAISVILLIIADYIFGWYWHDNLRNMRRMAAYVFVGIAFSSEFAKFLVLRYAFVKKGLVKIPLEGIIYSFFTGLGFSSIAAILYYTGLIGTERFHNATLFLWAYPFATLTFSVIMGFFLGMGETRKNAFIDNAVGLFLAIFFHATFYFCFVTSDLRLFGLATIGFILIGFSLLIKAVNIKE
jgi:RsiW-degrading membrane proteinase PrsW (M82 family)